jgi:hypothetical protein
MGNYTSSPYVAQANSAANQFGIDPAIFSGLIEAESSWNPNATPGTTSAWGLTQLTKGTAAGLGVNQYDPTQNLQGGAKYLSQLYNKFGNYTQALAAYHDGPGAIGLHGGYDYAANVLARAKKYVGGDGTSNGIIDTATNAVKSFASDIIGNVLPDGSIKLSNGPGGLLSAGGLLGNCGPLDFVCHLKNWLGETSFVQRLALYILGTIFIVGGIAFLGLGYKPQDLAKAALA